MSSTIQRFLFDKIPMRGAMVDLTDAWKTIAQQKDYPDGLQHFLSELIAANVLIAANIKFTGKIIIQINDNKKVGLIVSECTNDLKIRATAKFSENTHKDTQITYKDCVSQGILVISVDTEDSKHRYQSLVPLSNIDLATAIEEYMLQSEQLKSLFLFAYANDRVVGFMLQQLPDHASKFIEDIERVCLLAETLTTAELLNLNLDVLLKKVFPEDDIMLFSKQNVVFSCNCSLEKVTGMLRSLGHEEALSIIAERGSIEVTCDFCNTCYNFTENDVKNMFSILCIDIESISNEIH